MTFGDLDKAIPEEEEQSSGVTPEQEARALEFTRKMEETAIKTEDGKVIVRDSMLVFEFQQWCFNEQVSPTPELQKIFDDSSDWLQKQREKEAKEGILESEALTWIYSRQQLAKIEADPTNEALYGLTIIPRERQEAIRKSKEYFDYLDKFGHCTQPPESKAPEPIPSPIPPLEKPKSGGTVQVWADLDNQEGPKSREPRPVWSEKKGGFVYV